MLEKILRTPCGEKIITQNKKENLIKITGVLTSQIQLRGEGTKDPYYYSFIRCKGQSVDLPVIFKEKPTNLKKNDNIELSGNYSNSDKSIRKSFTAYSYQLLTEDREIESITLTGLTTSPVEQTTSYPYVFLKLNCAEDQKPCECSSLPVFFKIKEKPTIKKGSYLQVKGHFDDPIDGKKSFTAYSYQVLNHA